MTGSHNYIERKRFPRLLPLCILSAAVTLALYFAEVKNIIFIFFSAFSAIITAGVAWQEISRAMDRIEYPCCVICENSTTKALYNKDNLKMVKCDRCGLVFARPRYTMFRNLIVTQYFSFREIYKNEQYQRIHGLCNIRQNIQPRLELLKSEGYPANGSTLLDIGCGSGAFLKTARDAGFQVTGIEPGIFSSWIGRSKFKLKIINTSLERCEINQKFDVITCFHTIEHIYNPLIFINIILTMVKVPGIIILSSPNLGCDRSRDLGVEWESVGPADHVYLFDSVSIKSLFKKAKSDQMDIKLISGESEELLIIIRA